MSETTKNTKVLIIGSGPAGYTAAIYAARANLSPMLVTGSEPGGQLTITTDVENYPGFADVIQGPWLMEQMKAQAESVGTEMISDMIRDVDFSTRPYRCVGESGTEYIADTIIICTGAKARWLGLDREEELRGLGVSACATCDGFFFREKEVCVIGGGNAAVEEAIFLTNFCKKVTLIHRRDTLRAERITQERLFKNPKIDVMWDTVIDELIGEKPQGLTGLKLRNVKSGNTQDFKTDGLFIAIGHDPATEIFKGHVDMDSEGYIEVNNKSTETSVPGVYAAGDVTDKLFRQAVTAAGMGCMAALEADRFIALQEEQSEGSEAAA